MSLPRMSEATKNALLTVLNDRAGSQAKLQIYDAPQPSPGGAAITTQNKLAELICASGSFGNVGSGVLTAAAINSGVGLSPGGTAAWFRLVSNDGLTHVIDGDVSTTAGSGDLKLNTTSITIGGTVAVNSFTITPGN